MHDRPLLPSRARSTGAAYMEAYISHNADLAQRGFASPWVCKPPCLVLPQMITPTCISQLASMDVTLLLDRVIADGRSIGPKVRLDQKDRQEALNPYPFSPAPLRKRGILLDSNWLARRIMYRPIRAAAGRGLGLATSFNHLQLTWAF